MLIYLNGRLVPEEQGVISVFDRGFLLGDGLFETMLVSNGRPFRWEQHLERLRRGADFLGIRIPFAPESLREHADALVSKNQMPDALLRLTLSRGAGPRGYSPKGADRPTLVMSLHPAPVFDPQKPPKWKLATSSLRLPAGEALAQFKTCNKLPQILARAEAEAAGGDEALLLNTEGFVVEGSGSNLFCIDGDTVCTPPLASGILAGVTRVVVLEICRSLGLKAREATTTLEGLRQKDGIFLSVSSWGVVEAESLDGHGLKQSPLVEAIRTTYENLVRAECGTRG